MAGAFLTPQVAPKGAFSPLPRQRKRIVTDDKATAAEDQYNDDWEHRDAARKISALFANQVYVQPVGDGMLRINFGQVLSDDEPSYHTAVVVSARNAVAAGELLYRYGQSLLPLEPVVSPPPLVRTNVRPPDDDQNA
jgi:hypothetical protein